MKNSNYKFALLSFLNICLWNITFAQDCDEVLKDGVFNSTTISTSSESEKSFYQYIYSTDFTTHQEAMDAGISIGVPVYGVPVEIGGKFSKQQKDEWKRTHQEYKNETLTTSQKYNAVFKFASPDILEKWLECRNHPKERPGLSGWIEELSTTSAVLHITWIPIAGDRGLAPKVLTSPIIGGYRSEDMKTIAFPTNYKLLQGANGNLVALTRKTNETLIIVVHTTRGDISCVLKAPAKPRITIFRSNPDEVMFGESSTLIWSTSKSDQVSIDNGIGNVASNGSFKVTPESTTTYKITATNTAGSINEQATVKVKPQPPVLTGGSVSFHVTNDDKDDNTTISVYIKAGGNTVAQWSGSDGHWDDNSDHGPYKFTIVSAIMKDQLIGPGQMVLVESPSGHDEFHFNWSITLTFSDGTSKRYDWDGGNVDWDRTTISKPLP